MRMTTYVNGPAAVEVAWERYADPRLWSTWAPQIRSVDLDQEEATRIRLGLTGTVHVAFGVDVRFTITEVDEAARGWAWTAHPPGFTMHLTHTVERHPMGTRTGLAVDGLLSCCWRTSPSPDLPSAVWWRAEARNRVSQQVLRLGSPRNRWTVQPRSSGMSGNPAR